MNIRWYTDCDGEEVDLDNLNTYSIFKKWKNKKSLDLWDMGWINAGKSLFYMKYLHPGDWWGEQRKRVDRLCTELVETRKLVFQDSPENRLKMMNWLYRFDDEVENQC